jgi:tetratricopeptide (TPR) repeat protein
MSRSKKRGRQEKRPNQHRRELASRRARSQAKVDVCDRAAALIKDRRWHEARELLEEYERTHPGQRDVLRLLLDVYHEQKDYGPYCQMCHRLLEREPDNRPLRLMLAASYWADARLASALKVFRGFNEAWPNDPLADGARESIAQLEPAVDELLGTLPFAGDDRLELAAMHEDVLRSLNHGDFERTIRIAEQLLARSADFVPAMNNASEAYFRTGRTDDAVAMTRQALQRQSDNVHALANLTRYLFLSGRNHEAKEAAEHLRSLRPERDDQWLKTCEALGFLGDDEAVLATFADAKRAGATDGETPVEALLFHLAAVASARQGHHVQADRYWRQALKICPGLDLAKENVADAAQPVGQRHGPWPYSLNDWLGSQSVAGLVDTLDRLKVGTSDDGVSRAVKRYAEAHPEVVNLVPALLDRGDPAGREFACRFATLLGTPEMLDALRVFCLSQRGPDAMRLTTANRLRVAGALSSNCVRIWLDGHWQDTELLAFEITSEPSGPFHTPEVDELACQAREALRRRDSAEAERLFRKCLDLAGETPSLLNNLAATYAQQGRTDELSELVKRIHERWPDYFFGRIAMANMATMNGDHELAERYLAPLRRHQRLHISEFAGLAAAQIQLFIACRKLDAARSWLEMWRQIDPDDQNLHTLESRVRLNPFRETWRNVFRARRK